MFFGCLLGLCAASAMAADAKPHILVTVIDDHGWFDAGYRGSKIRTPTIDRFATSGLQLHQMFVQKVCSPTRTAIMTGRYPHRMGMQTPFCGGMAEGLNLNETLLPAHLATAGYVSHAVGKASALLAVFAKRTKGSFSVSSCTHSADDSLRTICFVSTLHLCHACSVAPRVCGLAFHANFQRL